MAKMQHPEPLPLSSLFNDLFLAHAFRRAELDGGNAFAVNPTRPVTLAGGAAAAMEAELEHA